MVRPIHDYASTVIPPQTDTLRIDQVQRRAAIFVIFLILHMDALLINYSDSDSAPMRWGLELKFFGINIRRHWKQQETEANGSKRVHGMGLKGK